MSTHYTGSPHGTPFGKYTLYERIAVGGMAEIFRAKAVGVRGFEKFLAIKRILPQLSEDPEFVSMFEDEAKIAAQLTHANIVQIYDLGEIDQALYIAMEYLEGRNLRDVTRQAKNRGIHLSVETAVYICIEICRGLDYAHRKRDANNRELQIIHRDISPQNIFVTYEGEVKILDFGIAKAKSQANKTEAGILKGKFGYMSPEQAAGRELTQQSDIFATGVILHELLTGNRLFTGKTDFEKLEKVKRGEVSKPSLSNPLVPPALDEIALKALSKEPSDRYASAADFQVDLTKFLYSTGAEFTSVNLSVFIKTIFSHELLNETAGEKGDGFSRSEQRGSRRTVPLAQSPAPNASRKTVAIEATLSKRAPKRSRIRPLLNLTMALTIVIGFGYFGSQWLKNSKRPEAPPSVQSPAVHHLDLATNPPGAFIQKNGVLLLDPAGNPAKTPFQYAASADEIDTTVTFAFILQGYTTTERTLELTTSTKIEPVTLTPTDAVLIVVADPATATVTVDGKRLSSGTEIKLQPGPHDLSVSQSGYLTYRRRVTLEPGAQQSIDVVLRELPPKAPKNFTVRLRGAPPQSEVRMNRKGVGRTTRSGELTLPRVKANESVEIEVLKKGFEPFKTTVSDLTEDLLIDVSMSELTPPTPPKPAAPPPDGILNVRPPKGVPYVIFQINKKPFGSAPGKRASNIGLPPGVHQVTCTDPSGRTKTHPVEIVSDSTVQFVCAVN